LKKKTRAKVSIGIVISALFLTIIFLKVTDRNSTIKLKDYNVASEYIQKGWVPKNISKNAKDILLVYNKDENAVNIKFTIPEKEIKNILDRTEKISLEKLKEEVEPLNIKFISAETKLTKNKDNAVIRKDNNYIYIIYPVGEIYLFNKKK
jgi:hypothetical protein